MTHLPPSFGSFRIVQPLATSPVGDRLLAVDDRSGASAVVHARPAGLGRKRRQHELAAVEAAAALTGPHLLPIQGWGFWAGSGDRLAWVTPFTGSASRLLTLRSHAASKGGTLAPREAATVLDHLWTGVRSGHAAGHVQGLIDPDAVLIDQHGRAWLENYGLARRLTARASEHEDAANDAAMLRKVELVSLASLVLELTTGLRPPAIRTLPNMPDWPEIPDAWRDRARAWSEDSLAASIAAALRAHDTLPAITSVLRDLLGELKQAEDSATRAAADAAKAAAKEAIKNTATSALKAVASSVWDLIRGR